MTSTPTEPSQLAAFLEEARRWVDEALGRYLPEAADEPGAACPARLAAAMRYSVLAGGKRLRPLLCLMAAEARGADPHAALPAACALELVHTYSLIHDDLPAMDDDDLRRGRPTCHKAFDEATAILAGDALLTLAFEVLARHVRPAEAASGCVRTLAQAAGPAGAVGLAFQIIDDLLDVQGDQAKLGKRVGKDSALGKWTYPGLLGIEGARRRAGQLADAAVAALAPLGARGARLRALALDLLERDR